MLLKPGPEWGPSLPEYRAVYRFNQSQKYPLEDIRNANIDVKQPLRGENGEPPSYEDA